MVFSQLLIVMIAAIAVTIFAERRGIQAPLLLALVGLGASFIPGFDRLELEPEMILTVVLPPLLFSAAREFSFVSFARRLGSISNLGVFLVVATTGVVGIVAATIVPSLTLPAAMVLAAVVSPPDAVTAVAIGRKLALPERLVTVLKGESLINDAAALTLFAFTTAAVTGTHLFTNNLLIYLGYGALAGILVGVVIGALVHRAQRRLENPSLATVLSVLVPFTAYLVAEELGASGVLAVVAAGFSLGHNSTATHYAARIQEKQFWRTTDALLEAFIFAYIGLQLRFVIEDATTTGVDIGELLWLTLLVLATAIGTRLFWVFATAALSRWRHGRIVDLLATLPPDHRLHRRGVPEPFPWRENLVIAWAGMRGVVTLAAAAGIPLLTASGDPFPARGTIQAIAFGVTIGTLLLQGLTLPWLIRVLGISDPVDASRRAAQVERAETLAQEATVAAVAAYRDRQTDPEARRIADRMLQRVVAEGNVRSAAGAEANSEVIVELAQAILAARRAAIIKARDDRRIEDDVMRDELEQMDLEQAVMTNWAAGRAG